MARDPTPPRTRCPDPLAMGAPVHRRRRTAPPTQVLQAHRRRKVHARILPQALSPARKVDPLRGGANRMKPSPRNLITHLRSLSHSGLLLGASLLVPANQRAEWRREWRGELWHVQQSCAPGGACGWQDERAMAAFCLGAFQDALCIRRSNFENKPFFAQSSGTPGRCLLALLTMLAAAYALALWLPGVAAERGLWPRKVSPNLVFIERATSHSLSAPSITPRQFRSWEGGISVHRPPSQSQHRVERSPRQRQPVHTSRPLGPPHQPAAPRRNARNCSQ